MDPTPYLLPKEYLTHILGIDMYCTFSKKMYKGSKLRSLTLAKWKLKHGRGDIFMYCIIGSINHRDQLDIINAAYLRQKYYKEHPVNVYGIASTMSEAKELLIRMSDDAIKAGQPGRIREYLDSINGA